MLLGGMRRVHQESQLTLTLGATVEATRIGSVLLMVGRPLAPIKDIVGTNLYDRQMTLRKLCGQQRIER